MRKGALCAVLITVFAAPIAQGAIPQRERDALLAVYNSTGGATWTFKDNWGGAPGTECTWYGVNCDEAQTTVVRVDLGFNNLSGNIPVAIADLSSLKELVLTGDNLRGAIPTQLGGLSKLEELELSENQLSGPIPTSFGALTNLTHLSIGYNELTGAIPQEIGNLTALSVISLPTNKLSGLIPSQMQQLRGLTNLDLSNNLLIGPLPDFAVWPQMDNLYLNDNRFTGPIPSSIGQMSILRVFQVYNNQLTGTIPRQIGNLPVLRELGLDTNQLTGTIPSELYGLPKLERLDLSRNQLTGSLSGDIARLTALTDLLLASNQLSGPLPVPLTSLAALRTLDLDTNAFTGPLPSDIGRLANLTYLDLSGNQFDGTIPASIGSLVNLETLSVAGNRLSGTLPESIFQFARIKDVLAGNNAFTGTIPATVSSATTLDYLDLGGNQLTGTIPADIGRLQSLVYLYLHDNELTGAIPESVWDLKSLVELHLEGNHFTGVLSPNVGGLTQLELLSVKDNDLSGPLPPQIGSLAALKYLDLGINRFTGAIPREMGQLKNVQAVDFGANNFRSVPVELTGMTSLVETGADFAYNALSITDPTLLAFVNRAQFDHDFAHSQTITPTSVRVTLTTDRSASVEWTPIAYTYDEGGYQVFASLTPGGAPASMATTSSKEISSITVRGLQPLTTYFFTVAAVTHPHDFQRNLIISDPSVAVSATTGARVLAPPDVVLTATPTGLLQFDGVPQNEDNFTLTNFGDVATMITLEKFDEDFYDVSPLTFNLDAGASQTVKITSIPKQPAGVRYGGVVPQGTGTTDDDIVTITLLSASRAGGNALAEALTSRVEVVGSVGTDSIGTVTFRNRGTATLTGILVADVPWIVPDSSPITIDPGSSALVRFTVKRSRRPAEESNGALTGTLSLIYVGALPNGSTLVNVDDTTPPAGVSITKVTVVDSTKPDVGPGNAPKLAQGEVAYFIAGLTAKGSGSSSLASDLHILNAFGAKPVSDLRLYYTSPTLKAVANLAALPASQAVTLVNVVSNVYSAPDQVGSMEVRSQQWQSLTVNAVLLRLVSGVGTYTGELPVFRSDRALRAKDTLYLTGIRQSGTLHATLYVEEVAGGAETIVLLPMDATGASLGQRELKLPAFGNMEISDLPAAASTVAVINRTEAMTPNGVFAYVRMSDDASGDTWSIVDWSRYYDFKRGAPVRLPLVESGGGGGKRRAVKHSAGIDTNATTPKATTSLSVFNASATGDARAKLTYGGNSKEVTVANGQTLTIADVASFIGASSAAQSLVIEPLHGEIVATSRLSIGSTVPVVEAASGLRVGQGQVFSGLEDSAASTVAASTPGTYRTDYGFVETGGAATTVRATLAISGLRTTATATRDFRLDAGGFILVNNLVRSIVGDSRDTQYRDLHDLKLQLQVVEGSGSILPFVIVTDNGSGDAQLRLQ